MHIASEPALTRRSPRAMTMKHAVAGAACAAALATGLTAAPALAVGDFGPDTCLEGFVWRDAFPGDHACVTAATRAQAADDNANADARRSPTGGPSGPDTCLHGYVWRDARIGDHVCVAPQTRTQAAADNQATFSRRNGLDIVVARVATATPTCSDGTCTVTSNTAQRWRVNVYRINVGRATLQLVRSNGRVRTWSVQVGPAAGRPGGAVSIRTSEVACNGAANAYFRIKDPASGRWSVRRAVRTCKTL